MNKKGVVPFLFIGSIMILLIAALIGVAQAADQPDLSIPLTLEQVIEIALERNTAILAAQKGVEVEDKNLSIARRQRIPRVDLFGSYQTFPSESRLPTREREFLALEEQNFSDLNNNLVTGGVRASVPLFTGGRIEAEIRAGEHATGVARQGFQKGRDELIFQVTLVYHQILMLQKLKEADELAVGNLIESKRIIERFVEVGKAPRLDLLRIETRLANVRQELIRANNAIEVADARLKTLMGLEGATKRIVLAGTLAYVPQPVDLQEGIRQALERQPSYLAQKEKVELLKQKVLIAQSERLPQISLSGGYLIAHGFESDRSEDATEAMVSLSIPIFDGGLIRTRVAREQAELERAQREEEGIKLSVIFDVKRSYQDLIEADERVKNTEVSLDAAREGLRIEQLKLETGKGIVNDVLDAQADLLKAEVNYAEALADHRVAYAALRRAIGDIEHQTFRQEVNQP